MSIWVKSFKYLDFGQNCRKISIWVDIYGNLDFGKIAENVDYSQNFRIMSIWVKNYKYFNYGQNCRIISSLVNIYGNLNFGQNLWKSRFWTKLSENLDLDKIR